MDCLGFGFLVELGACSMRLHKYIWKAKSLRFDLLPRTTDLWYAAPVTIVTVISKLLGSARLCVNRIDIAGVRQQAISTHFSAVTGARIVHAVDFT